MLTEMERQPLKHMRGVKETLMFGALLFLTGSGLMVFGGDERAVLSAVSMAAGAGLCIVCAYYWGCDNVSCSPRDL
jgi:hypothetical protein